MRSKYNVFFLLLVSWGFSFHGFSQGIQGEWVIDHLMLGSDKNEYVLSPVDTTSKRWHDYGNHFSLNKNGSFRCWYTARCTMDCFRTSEGKFTIVDEHHIRFVIDTVHQHGRMCVSAPAQVFPFEVGLFYIDKYEDEIRLIRSDGNVEQDKLNVSYIELIEEYSEQNSKLTDLFEEIKPAKKALSTPENIVELYVSSINKEDYTILYSKEVSRHGLAVLVEIDGTFKCIYCLIDEENGENFIQQIKIYTTELIDKIDRQVAEIDLKSKKFKPEVSIDESEGVHSTARVFSRKGQVEKVILEREFSRGMEAITYYLKDDTVFFARVEVDGGSENLFSCREFYLKPNGTLGSKEVARSATGGIHRSQIYYCLPYLNAILENKN